MLTKNDRAELMAALRALENERWAIRESLRSLELLRRAAAGREEIECAYLAIKKNLLDMSARSVDGGLRMMLARDDDRRQRGLPLEQLTRVNNARASATKRRTVVLEAIAAAPRSLRELLPLLKRKRCSCAPAKLGDELRALARARLIACDGRGRRGARLWITPGCARSAAPRRA
jgi:hypothetical protein